MLKKIKIVFCILILFTTNIFSQTTLINPRTDQALLKTFQDGKLGLMLSFFAVYTPKTGDSWSIGKGTPKRVADSIALAWDPAYFNARKIVQFAVNAGCKYIVVVAKHHDGFGIWKSQFTDFDIKQSKFKGDILKELGDECRKEGLLFGIYYSIADLHYCHWDYMPTAQKTPPIPEGGKPAFVQYCKNQVKELIDRYDPDILWFDGFWLGTIWNRQDGENLYTFIKSIKPDVLTTRLSSVKDSDGHAFFAIDGSSGDFFSYEAKTTDAPSFPWEAVTSISYPVYGYDPNAKMLSKEKLITMFDKVICGNGNFLLSIGPKRNGELPIKEEQQFLLLSDWIKQNKQAVYNTSGGPFKQGVWGGSTYKKNDIFIHLRTDVKKITIASLEGYEILSATDMTTGKKLKVDRKGRGFVIALSGKTMGTNKVSIVQLRMNKFFTFTHWLNINF